MKSGLEINYQNRLRQSISRKIDDNNSKIRSNTDISDTSIGGFRGGGLYQRGKYGGSPKSSAFVWGGNSGGTN